jgi:Family of unknown function (DUF6982)
MLQIKVIARYQDGRMVKGHTHNFAPHQAMFHLTPADLDADREAVEVRVSDLKAIFIVRDFEGDPEYDEDRNPAAPAPGGGRLLQVTFKDRETLIGRSLEYNPSGAGFWMFPVDPNSNNQRIFVVNAAVDAIEPVSITAISKAG